MPNWSSDPSAFGNVSDVEAELENPQYRPQVSMNDRVDSAMTEIQEATNAAQDQMTLMLEARARLAKAALYEEILQNGIFDGADKDQVTQEVESEFLAFAQKQMMKLCGMELEEEEKKASSQFSDDQAEFLRLLADRALVGKISTQPVVKPASPQVRVVPQPPPMIPTASVKRRPGRPPGTGKHQKAGQATQAAAVQATKQPLIRPSAPVPPRMVTTPQPRSTGLIQRQDQPAIEKRTVTLPNGQIKEIQVQRGQVIPQEGGPLPMPSPEEQIAQAAMLGDAGARGFQASVREKVALAEAEATMAITQG